MTTFLSASDDYRNLTTADTVIGLSGNDFILGALTGGSVIYGNSGDDTLISQARNDTLYGGQGSDTITIQLGNVLAFGDGGADLINGYGSDTIYGGGFGQGADGADTITTGTVGNSLAYGNAGDDTITVGGKNDSIWGGQGNDSIVLGTSNSTGSSGGLYISGDKGNDTILGHPTLGSTTTNTLIGGEGNDYIRSDGKDWVYGNVGNDTFYTAVSDTAYGGQGDDSILGPGAFLFGDKGNDTINFTGTAAFAYGGDDNDYLAYTGAAAGSPDLYGNLGNDSLYSSGTGALLYGGQGNDYLWGSASYFGGDLDNDTIVIQNSVAGGITANGGAGDDSIVANYNGTFGATLLGGLGNDTIFGGSGADSILGGEGNDWLYSGSGGDTLTGGNGNDFFFETKLSGTLGSVLTPTTGTVAPGQGGWNPFSAGTQGTTAATAFDAMGLDTITDFTSGTDKLYLQLSGLFGTNNTLPSGQLPANNTNLVTIPITNTGFGSNTAALNYDNTTGVLFYNANSGTSGDEIALVRFTPNTTLIGSDIVIF